MRARTKPFRALLLPLAVSLFPLGLHPAGAAGSADPELLRRGEQALASKRYQSAADAFAEADRRAGGGCAECLLGQSRAYSLKGDRRRAAELAREAVRLDPPAELKVRALNHLGVVLIDETTANRGTLEEAAIAFRQVLELAPDRWSVARANLAEVLRRLGRYEEAAAAAGEYLERSPGGPAAKPARITLCRSRAKLPKTTTADGPAPPPPPPPQEAAVAPAAPAAGGGVSAPVILHRTEPIYPASSRLARRAGKITVEAVIDETGCVDTARVLTGVDGHLDQAVLDAVRDWVFLPAMYEGKPVRVYYGLTVQYGRSHIYGH